MWENLVRLSLLVLAIAVVIQMTVLFLWVPNPMPQRFNLEGEVVRTMDKHLCFLLFGALQVLMLLGLPVLGRFLTHMPNELINMPNRDYWLHEDRRAESIRVSRFILNWTAIASSLLMAVLFQLTAMSAMKWNVDAKLWIWASLICYLVFVVGVLMFSLHRFRLPESAKRSLDSAT